MSYLLSIYDVGTELSTEDEQVAYLTKCWLLFQHKSPWLFFKAWDSQTIGFFAGVLIQVNLKYLYES
jgi:hypothetical protein